MQSMDLADELLIILKQDDEKCSMGCHCCHRLVKVLLPCLRILLQHYSPGPQQNLYEIHSLSLPLHSK